MSPDTRVEALRAATAAMRRGEFRFELPTGEPDEVGALARDLSELAHGLERRFAEYEALSRLTRDLNSGLLLDEVLERVYASFRRVIPYDRIGFALLEDGGRTLRAYWAKMEYAHACLTKGYSAPMAGSSLQTVLETGRPRIINDLRDYHAAHPGSAATNKMLEEGVLSSLTCPLRARGRAVGFLFFSSRYAKTYEDAHVEVFLQVAETVAAILEKSRLYEELMRLDRMKNSFLGMAAHDLRGPLANVVSYAELLAAGVIADEAGRQEAYAELMRIAESSLRLVESLLDVTAIESGHIRLKLQRVPLRPYLERLQATAVLMGRRKGMVVGLMPETGLPQSFTMDPERVEQALLNLVANAFKFCNSGTRVTLTAGALPDGSLRFGVQDEGPGLRPELRDKLFHEFTPGQKGICGERSTGLGLAIVKRIAEEHGGRVAVESEPGRGAHFTMTLPAAGSGPELPAPKLL